MSAPKKIEWNGFVILTLGMCLWMLLNAYTAYSMSKEWRLVHDSPILHYTASMILKGYMPYRDIIEINLPFTYWIHMLAITVFGNGDMAFRQFDMFWTIGTSVAIGCLCWRSNPLLALTAGFAYVVIHISNGPPSMAQRDFLMTLFLVAGACLSVGGVLAQGHQLWRWLATGVVFGGAVAIKPIALILPAVIVLSCVYANRPQWKSWIKPALSMGTGTLVPVLASFWWMISNGIWDEFIEVITRLVAAIYVPVEITDWVQKSAALTTATIMLMFIASCGKKQGLIVHYRIIQAGLVYGLLHYVLQRKGFWYNLYPAIAFGLAALSYGLQGLFQKVIFEGRLLLTGSMFAACVYTSQAGLLSPEGMRTDGWLTPFFAQMDQEFATAQKEVLSDFPEMQAPDTRWKVHFFDYTHCALFNYAYRNNWQPSSRFLHPYPFYLDTPVMRGWRKEMLNDFAMNPPDIIFVCKQSWPLEDGAVYKVIDGKDGNTDVSGFFSTHYRQVYQNGMYRIYVRKRSEKDVRQSETKQKEKHARSPAKPAN